MSYQLLSNLTTFNNWQFFMWIHNNYQLFFKITTQVGGVGNQTFYLLPNKVHFLSSAHTSTTCINSILYLTDSDRTVDAITLAMQTTIGFSNQNCIFYVKFYTQVSQSTESWEDLDLHWLRTGPPLAPRVHVSPA